MQKQNTNHIDNNIHKVFHFLELKGVHSHLIGSQSLKGMLYANDYDLNTEMNISDTVSVLNGIYHQFVHIFDTAHKNKDYYITDFKNGTHNGEPIRWSLGDIRKGDITVQGHKFTFQECLLHDENIIKLDLVYIHNNLFTDINMLYNFKIKGTHEHTDENDIIETLDKDIQSAQDDGNYFKALKRQFSKSIIQGTMDSELLDLLNSDYGLVYQSITSLRLVHLMTEQQFKPISDHIIKLNLEHIKDKASHITSIDMNEYLDELNHIITLDSKDHIMLSLDITINHMEHYFNKMLKQNHRHEIYGGAMGLKMNTLHKMLDGSYSKKPTDVNGYVLDKSLSGQRAQVYHHPETNHLVVSHRGTSGIQDIGTDIKMMLGFKKNKRFKHGKAVTDQAINKYGKENVSIIGHSLGHSIAKESNKKHKAELITLNGAVTPHDMFDKQKSNEHIIRSKYDPISALHTLNPYKKKSNTYTLDNKLINPLASHSTDVLDGVDDIDES